MKNTYFDIIVCEHVKKISATNLYTVKSNDEETLQILKDLESRGKIKNIVEEKYDYIENRSYLNTRIIENIWKIINSYRYKHSMHEIDIVYIGYDEWILLSSNVDQITYFDSVNGRYFMHDGIKYKLIPYMKGILPIYKET